MAHSITQVLAAGVSLLLAALPAWAQSGEQRSADARAAERAEPSLSSECFVPDGKLFALAPKAVRASSPGRCQNGLGREASGQGPHAGLTRDERAWHRLWELSFVAGTRT